MASLLPGDSFESFKIMEDIFIALLPPNFSLSAHRLTWEDLHRAPLITSSSECCYEIRDHLKQAQPPIEMDY